VEENEEITVICSSGFADDGKCWQRQVAEWQH
jgi:hypothetical protein